MRKHKVRGVSRNHEGWGQGWDACPEAMQPHEHFPKQQVVAHGGGHLSIQLLGYAIPEKDWAQPFGE